MVFEKYAEDKTHKKPFRDTKRRSDILYLTISASMTF